MQLFITEYVKVLSVENGVASGTFSVPADLLDELMFLSSAMLNASRVLKMKSMARASESNQSISRFGAKNK